VVTSLVANIFTPLIAAIFGKPDFSTLSFTINKSVFTYGAFINALISFILIALVVFLFIIKPMNYLLEKRRRGLDEDDTDERACPFCRSEIPKVATRCAFCTSEVPAVDA